MVLKVQAPGKRQVPRSRHGFAGLIATPNADVFVVVGFIAGSKTARALELRITDQEQLFSMYRRFLISSFSLFAHLAPLCPPDPLLLS